MPHEYLKLFFFLQCILSYSSLHFSGNTHKGLVLAYSIHSGTTGKTSACNSKNKKSHINLESLCSNPCSHCWQNIWTNFEKKTAKKLNLVTYINGIILFCILKKKKISCNTRFVKENYVKKEKGKISNRCLPLKKKL